MRHRAWKCLAPTAIAIALLLPASPARLDAQADPPYQTDFPPDEFKARWARIYDHIGADAVAVVQGVGMTPGFMVPRQNNEFYYLCGVETPGAYLMLDGRTRTAALYLPRRNTRLEAAEGRVLSADDAELVRRLTGVDQVHPVEAMRENWPPPAADPAAGRAARLVIYTPFAPAENYAVSRGEAVSAARAQVADYWDQRPSEELNFVHLLQTRLGAEVRDLTPVLDELRSVKSPREIDLIRRASQIAALGLVEAMKATQPGVYEYHLDAAARYVFLANGARLDGYRSITAAGMGNILNMHYFRNTERAEGRRPRADGLRAGLPLLHQRRRPHVAGQRHVHARTARAAGHHPGVSQRDHLAHQAWRRLAAGDGGGARGDGAGVRAMEVRQARARAGRTRHGAHRRRRVLASGRHGRPRRRRPPESTARRPGLLDRSAIAHEGCGRTVRPLHALRRRRRGDATRLRELHGLHADDAGRARAHRAAEGHRPGLSAQRDAVESPQPLSLRITIATARRR